MLCKCNYLFNFNNVNVYYVVLIVIQYKCKIIVFFSGNKLFNFITLLDIKSDFHDPLTYYPLTGGGIIKEVKPLLNFTRITITSFPFLAEWD